MIRDPRSKSALSARSASVDGRVARARACSSSQICDVAVASPATLSSASNKNANRASAPAACAAASNDPNGSAAPAGAANAPDSAASAQRDAHAAAFEPATATARSHSAAPRSRRSSTWPAAEVSATSAGATRAEAVAAAPPAAAAADEAARFVIGVQRDGAGRRDETHALPRLRQRARHVDERGVLDGHQRRPRLSRAQREVREVR